MDYEKAVDWVNSRRALVLPPDEFYEHWCVVALDCTVLVKEGDKCTSWIQAVNLAMIRS